MFAFSLHFYQMSFLESLQNKTTWKEWSTSAICRTWIKLIHGDDSEWYHGLNINSTGRTLKEKKVTFSKTELYTHINYISGPKQLILFTQNNFDRLYDEHT